MRKTIIKGLVLSVALNGLAFAASDIASPSSPARSEVSAPNDRPGNPAVVPSGSGTTDRGMTPMAAQGSSTAGTIQSIKGSRVTIKDAQGVTKDYKFNKETVFTLNGKMGRASDMRVGDRVDYEANADGVITKFGVTTPSQNR